MRKLSCFQPQNKGELDLVGCIPTPFAWSHNDGYRCTYTTHQRQTNTFKIPSFVIGQATTLACCGATPRALSKRSGPHRPKKAVRVIHLL